MLTLIQKTLKQLDEAAQGLSKDGVRKLASTFFKDQLQGISPGWQHGIAITQE